MVIWLPPSQAVSTETWTPFIIALPTAPWRSPLFSPTHYVHLKLASWWSPLINPRGIICVAAYVNGALENHTREIHWEDVQHEWSWLPKGLRYPCTFSGQAMISKFNVQVSYEESVAPFWPWLATVKRNLITNVPLSARKLRNTISRM